MLLYNGPYYKNEDRSFVFEAWESITDPRDLTTFSRLEATFKSYPSERQELFVRPVTVDAASVFHHRGMFTVKATDTKGMLASRLFVTIYGIKETTDPVTQIKTEVSRAVVDTMVIEFRDS